MTIKSSFIKKQVHLYKAVGKDFMKPRHLNSHALQVRRVHLIPSHGKFGCHILMYIIIKSQSKWH